MSAKLRLVSDQPHPVPQEHIETFKSIWALCTLNKATGELSATHYALVQVGGSNPMWAVYTIQGRFVRFAGSRAQIERAYPKLRWRRWMARWDLLDADNISVDARRKLLADRAKEAT
jgi:hypothetical protein